MRADPIVFPLANPDPEIDPAVAQAHPTVVASGRSDLPNQINTVLAFPGVFRGLLDARARVLALADVVQPHELHPDDIIPSAFNASIVEAVAAAVRAVAPATT